MNKIKFSALFFIAAMSMILANVIGVDITGALAIFTGLVLLSFIPMPKGVSFMAITKEVWTQDIVDNLYKDNTWARRAFDADMYVLMGKVVHIPVAGAASSVTKNRTVFPVNGVKRADADLTYNIDTFYSDPRHIEKIEEVELAYDKRQSAMGEDQSALIESAMNNLLYLWLPAVDNVILTTGAAGDPTVTGATGQRLKMHKNEFKKIKKLMDKNNIPQAGRVCVLTTDHYNDFLDTLTDNETTNVGRVANLAEGLVGKYYGFEIYTRSTVGRYRGADAAVAKVDEQDGGFAANTEDRAASIFYHEKSVERAQGAVDIFENKKDAEYYGDVFSMTLRFGGRLRRTTGVYAVVEAIV